MKNPANPIVCRICSGPVRLWPRPWLDFEWGRCRQCGSVQKLIQKSTFDELSPSYDPGFLSAHSKVQSELEEFMDVDGKGKLLKKLLGPTESGKLLDIGCGMGGFLLAGKRLGYEVCGVEPSLTHGKAAIEVFGLNVTNGYFNSRNFSVQFDVVILSHVIEHIYQPNEFLDDVMRVVAPGGRVIIITPNCESLGAIVCGHYWSMYKPIDHVTLFSKKALKRSLPLNTTFQKFFTSEWPGEFAAHLASALKTAHRPLLSNVGAGSDANSVRQITMSFALRFLLGVLSFPFFVLARAVDRQSCLYAVVIKSTIALEGVTYNGKSVS
jgi:2-polyprenyl-3-methyl-5-hydroxy-6-metoxy-1,4-benzoquinol methylase